MKKGLNRLVTSCVPLAFQKTLLKEIQKAGEDGEEDISKYWKTLTKG